MKIFFSAGEPSGDLHGANLIRELRAISGKLEAVGYGGPEMAAAGCQVQEDLTRLAVMWFSRVLLNLHRFLALVFRADRYFRRHRPDAVVLIDYPGFNWWIARRAKAHGIPVFYYGAPQMWAWGTWRIRKMRRLVDHVLCMLPFEQPWYQQRGCAASYVGHPFFDEVRRHKQDVAFMQAERKKSRPLVVLLPGSRNKEVTDNLRSLLSAAHAVHREVPGVRFAVAAFRSRQADYIQAMIDASEQYGRLPIEVYTRRTPELIALADCCIAVSGSVSLELLHYGKPTVIVYWLPRLFYFLQQYLLKVKYITLVNLLATPDIVRACPVTYDPQAPDAERVPFPEYLGYRDRSADVAGHVVAWLTDAELRQEAVTELAALRERFGAEGASRRAASTLLRLLAGKQGPPRPHFLPVTKPGSTVSSRRDLHRRAG